MVALATPGALPSCPPVLDGRRRTDPVAVHRRRDARQRRKELRRQRRRDEDAERPAWEAAVVARLLRRYVHPLDRLPIHYSHAYWSARRMGWDVLNPRWRGHGPAEASPVWVWWSGLTWRQRDEVTGERRPKVSVQTVTLTLGGCESFVIVAQ